MKNSRFLSGFGLPVLALMLFRVPLYAAQESEADLQNCRKAEELWELAIAAKGGREQLRQVHTLYVRSSMSAWSRWRHNPLGSKGVGKDYRDLYVLPGKHWSWRDDRPSTFRAHAKMRNCDEGLIGYEDSWRVLSHLDLGPGNETCRNELVRAQVLYLMETQWVKPIPTKLEHSVLEQKEVDLIHTVVQGRNVLYYLDKKTHLPSKVTVLDSGCREDDYGRCSRFLSDYTTVHGLQMPGKERAYRLQYEFNVDFSPNTFQFRPVFAAGPEAWRGRGGSSIPDQPLTEGGRQEAEELWEQAINAKGGRERLLAVRNLHVSSRAVLTSKTCQGRADRRLHVEEIFVFPEKYWAWEEDCPIGSGARVVVLNGAARKSWNADEGGHTEEPLRGSGEETLGKYRLFLGQVVYLMESAWLKPVPVKSLTGRMENKRIDVVFTEVGTYEIKFYLDGENHLPIRAYISGISIDGERRLFYGVALSDYVEVGGIQFPQRMGFIASRAVDPGVDYDIEANVEYDESIFQQPPSIRKGSDAWRRRVMPQ